jgi:tetratricopeptide (TPR) repeat protein
MSSPSADAIALKEAGNEAIKAGDYEGAVAAYTRALELDPSSAVLYHNRAVARLRQQRWEDALGDADAALALKPDYTKAVNTRGAALQRLGRLDEAAAAFRMGCVARSEGRDATSFQTNRARSR